MLTTLGAVTLGCITLICVERCLKNSKRQLRTRPLPPGPPGLPWVGNVIGIDTGAPWVTYSKWAKIYGKIRFTELDVVLRFVHSPRLVCAGDLICTRLLGKDIIIINSEKVAKDLLEYHSRNYSDRPYLITNELWVLLYPLTSALFK